jgi:glycosyltransferase 2 family protein
LAPALRIGLPHPYVGGRPRGLGFTSRMVSRERLRRRETMALRVGGRLLAAGLVIGIGLRLWQLWRRQPVDLGKLDAGVFVVAVLASATAVAAYGLVWPYILRRLGTDAPFSWVALFFKSQLGKYLPGSVWQYAGRVALTRGRGVPTQRVLVSVIAEVTFSAIAAGLVGLLVLGSATGGIACGGIVALGLVVLASRRRLSAVSGRLAAQLPSRTHLDRESLVAAIRAAPQVAGLYVLVWVIYGLAFWLTGRALFDVPASQLPRYVGVFALGWLVGLVAVFAPGGIGVREAVIVALLRSRLGEANAIVLAAASRIVLTGVDLSAGAASLSVPAFLRRQGASPAQARR